MIVARALCSSPILTVTIILKIFLIHVFSCSFKKEKC